MRGGAVCAGGRDPRSPGFLGDAIRTFSTRRRPRAFGATGSAARVVRGFLYGLGSCPDLDWTRLGEESREAVADLTALSRVTAQAEPSDAAEADYFELVEYVRVGVMMINEDLHHDRLAAARPTGDHCGRMTGWRLA